jgi:phospholipid-translocating ATPase
MITVSQFFPPLRVGFLFTYVAPLSFVLIITILKESVDDFKRYKKDLEQNTQKFKKITSEGEVDLTSAEIAVGDVIKIHQNERIPADMILLHTSDKSGSIFLRTDQLDGETDWKLRKPVQLTQEITDYKKFINDNAYIFADPPNKQIYKFEGNFVMKVMNNEKKESLSLEQTMWANTVLASCMAIGVVIYTGKETRAQKNSSQPTSKIGALDLEINAISKALFIFMGICAVMIVGLSGFEGSLGINLINIFRYILLLSSIIPISLRVNLDFAKIIYSFKISNDPNIPGTIARNSTIPEELGRIQFLFTDKTGTLTKNEMVFKTVDQIQAILVDECRKSNGPLKDYEDNLINMNQESSSKRRFRRKSNCVIRDCITALGICHNVTPVYENDIKEYQASSPDEVALVKFADSLGIKLDSRTQNTMTIINAADKKEEYEILANFPFSSETKRMGILVKHIESNRLIFYLKGAEVVMEEKVQDNSQGFLRENCESLASAGLRTLVISQKYLTWEEFETWKRKYEVAKTEMENREEKVRKVIDELEKSMEFLAVTGVEDKLQDDVGEAIESLRNGGVKVWMLTGDKVETATCIAISTGLKTKDDKLFFMKEMKDVNDVKSAINEFSEKTKTILVIDGNTLNIALNQDIEKMFFDIASKVQLG